MKKVLIILTSVILCTQNCYALDFSWNFTGINEKNAVKKVLKNQVKYANRNNFNKFISTYDEKYVNSDGFNLDVYSSLVKDIWNTYDNIEYAIKINNISIDGNKATVDVLETSYAKLPATGVYEGELSSEASSVYYLEKKDNKWKVVSDSVLEETTTMLYGEAKDLDIKLIVPEKIKANTEYSAMLEFIPPNDTIAIASLSSDIVEYPQKPTKEVFRAMPDDNILERLFTSNNQNANEYIVASIGLTRTSVNDFNIRLSLTGFGYSIKRVNVIHDNGENNVKK